MYVVHDEPQMVWMPVGVGETLYGGQLIKCINEGAYGVDTALGWFDNSRRGIEVAYDVDGNSTAISNMIYGVVVGTNLRTTSQSSRTNTESITYASPNAANTDTYFAPGGPWAAGDTMAMVKVSLIDATTTLRSSLYQSSSVVGTALTVGTVSATSSGTACTHSALGITGQVSHSTVYFRSGEPAGQYRIADINASTSSEWDLPLSLGTSSNTYADATVVRATLRTNGFSRAQISTDGTFLNSGAVGSSDFFSINVVRLDLRNAGEEYVEFKIDPIHLSTATGETT